MIGDVNMNIRFETYYERCRALVHVVGMDGITEEDRMALIAVLEDEFEKLGDSLKDDD